MEKKLGKLLLAFLAVLFVGSPTATAFLNVGRPIEWINIVALIATFFYSVIKVAVFMSAVALLVHLALTERWKWIVAYLGTLTALAIFSQFAYGFTGDGALKTAFYFFDHFLPGNRWLLVSGPTYVANFVYFLATFLGWTLVFRNAHVPQSA